MLDPTKNVSLYDWAASEDRLLKAFHDKWRMWHKQGPKTYPAEMKPGDWDEQFVIFCEQQEAEERERAQEQQQGHLKVVRG